MKCHTVTALFDHLKEQYVAGIDRLPAALIAPVRTYVTFARDEWEGQESDEQRRQVIAVRLRHWARALVRELDQELGDG